MRRKVYDTNSEPSIAPVMQDERAIKRLTSRITEMEAELRVLGTASAPALVEPGDSGAVNRDIRWHCKKCGYLLAFYDKNQDVMRTRYKEHIVYMRAGVGGFIQIVCRGCSEVNTQEYVEVGKEEDSKPVEIIS
jgi:hypothetical protein